MPYTSRKPVLILLALIILSLLTIAIVRWKDGDPPEVDLTQPFSIAGRQTPLSLHVEDLGSGLKAIEVTISYRGESYPVAKETFPSKSGLWAGGKERAWSVTLTPFQDLDLPGTRGQATLIVTAEDYSWRHFPSGNTRRFVHEFQTKFTPPRLEILSPQFAMTQGGSELVLYRVSEDAVRHGIQVESDFFPGYPTPTGSDQFVLFGFPYNAPPETPIQLVAEDAAGNTAIRSLHFRVIPQNWRTRRITISDDFIQQTVLPIIGQSPQAAEQGDPLQNFLEVNQTLRRLNNQTIAELRTKTRPEFLWKGPFKQLSGSQVESAFADHRNYYYRGEHVDTQDHLGIDLAATRHYPIEASNRGIVVYADYLGIYGNTVVIDHGYGLQSLYAHLASFAVAVGDTVARGQVIGRSDTTGLAGGDHLHFSMLLHGVQVNPREWWDPHWVQTRIHDRLRPNQTSRKPFPPERLGN